MSTTRPLRVAIVNESADPQRGGAETSIREMAFELAALGCSVTLVFAGRQHAAEAAGPVASAPLPVEHPLRSGRARQFISRALEYLAAQRFDVVHAVSPLPRCDVYQPRGGTFAETIARSNALAGSGVAGALRRLGRRFNRRQQYLAAVERQLLRGGGVCVAAVSAYVARQARELGAAPERVRIIFNGVRVPPRDPQQSHAVRQDLRRGLNLGPADPLVLFLAHNFRLKGLRELLLAAAAAAGATPWRLAVVGRDNERPYRALAQRLGIGGRIHFAGAGRALDWLAAADVLAHPTWYDPCSRVVLEALLLGLPVVTTPWNGAAELLRGPDSAQHGGRGAGVIVQPDDIGGLAAGVERCLEPQMRAAAQAAAPALREQLSMARHAAELLRLYQELRAGSVPG